MSDHLIAEAHRHAMALPTTHPTHADIAWYVREVSGLRAELALLREWQREVIQNANAHHAERKDAIARAESAEREAFDWKKIARYEAARAERAEAELAKERARLDWLMAGGVCMVQHTGGFHVSRLHAPVSRAAIDAAMKEDAK